MISLRFISAIIFFSQCLALADSYDQSGCVFGSAVDCVRAGATEYFNALNEGYGDWGEESFTLGCKKKKDKASCLGLQCFKTKECHLKKNREKMEGLCSREHSLAACVFLNVLNRNQLLPILPEAECNEQQLKNIYLEHVKKFELELNFKGPFCDGKELSLPYRVFRLREAENATLRYETDSRFLCLSGDTVQCQSVILYTDPNDAAEVIEAACLKYIRKATSGPFYCGTVLNRSSRYDITPRVRKLMRSICNWPKDICGKRWEGDCKRLREMACKNAKL